MILKHKTQRRYQYGGTGIFDIAGKLASKIAAKTPEMIAKAQANDLINKVTKEVVKQGEKALVDNAGKLAKAAVKKIVDKVASQAPVSAAKQPSKDVVASRASVSAAKQMATDLINSLPYKSQPKNTQNLNSLISGMGLKPLAMGSGIILD
jgi:hypothetical protein